MEEVLIRGGQLQFSEEGTFFRCARRGSVAVRFGFAGRGYGCQGIEYVGCSCTDRDEGRLERMEDHSLEDVSDAARSAHVLPIYLGRLSGTRSFRVEGLLIAVADMEMEVSFVRRCWMRGRMLIMRRWSRTWFCGEKRTWFCKENPMWAAVQVRTRDV